MKPVNQAVLALVAALFVAAGVARVEGDTVDEQRQAWPAGGRFAVLFPAGREQAVCPSVDMLESPDRAVEGGVHIAWTERY